MIKIKHFLLIFWSCLTKKWHQNNNSSASLFLFSYLFGKKSWKKPVGLGLWNIAWNKVKRQMKKISKILKKNKNIKNEFLIEMCFIVNFPILDSHSSSHPFLLWWSNAVWKDMYWNAWLIIIVLLLLSKMKKYEQVVKQKLVNESPWIRYSFLKYLYLYLTIPSFVYILAFTHKKIGNQLFYPAKPWQTSKYSETSF